MKKQILRLTAILGLFGIIFFTGCSESCKRDLKSCQSEYDGGLNRVINVYSMNGKLLATYEGKVDVDNNNNGSIMFDLNGKRYVYYNAIIEIIEK
jgi:hypothetical protein